MSDDVDAVSPGQLHAESAEEVRHQIAHADGGARPGQTEDQDGAEVVEGAKGGAEDGTDLTAQFFVRKVRFRLAR